MFYFDFLFQLSQCLPSRTIGHSWRLIYSTYLHGISLKTMYRTLAEYDIPALLVILDDSHQVNSRGTKPVCFQIYLMKKKHVQRLNKSNFCLGFWCVWFQSFCYERTFLWHWGMSSLYISSSLQGEHKVLLFICLSYSAKAPTVQKLFNQRYFSFFSQVFRWSGENNFFIKGDTDSLAFGGGQ